MRKRQVRTLFIGILTVLCSVFAVNVVQKCEVLAAENLFEMTQGGSIRIAEPYGLRFRVKMSADVKDMADKVGMLIFPADYLVDNGTDGDVYYESVEALAKTNVTSHRINLDLTSKLYEKDGYWYGNGAIVNIKEKNMAREFVGIAYYEVDDNITFADTSKVKDTTRSAAQVALLTHADKTNEFSDETDKLLVKYIDHLKLSGVEDSAPSRYKVRGYAADNGLRFHIVQYVDNLISTGDAWTEQTHLEAQIWQHNMGQGVQYGLSVDTYCAFWLDGSSWFNNYVNIKNVTNQVTISDKGEDSAADYRYEICYEIFIEFDNNLENPADGPYAFVQFKHHMPGEEVEGFENARKEHRDDNRYLWQDKSESSWFRSTGIVEQQMGISRFQEQIKDRKLQWLEKGNDGRTTLFIGDSFFDPYFWSNFYTESYPGKDALVLGIGSTTTYDWETWATEWLKDIKPKNIVMHMGTNNIYDDGDDVEATVSALKDMFATIHENVPDTPIYWFGISYRSYGDAKIEKTTEVNNQMKEWCEEQDYMTYIDTPSKLTNDMLFDGTHPAPEYYYVFKDALAETDIVIEDSLLTVETDASTRYQVRGYAADEGLRVNAVQYVDNVVSIGDKWTEQTHLEAQIWQHNIGMGVDHGFSVDTYFAFFQDGTYYVNNNQNIKSVTNNVTIHDRGAGYADGYRYAVFYEIFIEFDNNLENPADGPYAFMQFKHHMPGETEVGFENANKEYRDNNRYLYQDYCNSYEFHKPGIIGKDGELQVGSLATANVGTKIWTDKNYVFTSLPAALEGKNYLQVAIGDAFRINVDKEEWIYVITPAAGVNDSQAKVLDGYNFTRLDVPMWRFCNAANNSVWVYEKRVEPGEFYKLNRWAVVFKSDTKLDLTAGNPIVSDAELAILESKDGYKTLNMTLGSPVFTDRTAYTFYDMPYWLAGKNYIYNPYAATTTRTAEATRAGYIYMLTSTTSGISQITNLMGQGFEEVTIPTVDLFGNSTQNGIFDTLGFSLLRKEVQVGDTITWNKWAIPIFSGDLQLSSAMAELEPNADTSKAAKLTSGARLFSNRTYYVQEKLPSALDGKSFLYDTIENGGSAKVTKAGKVYIAIPVMTSMYDLETQVKNAGWTQTPYRIFRLSAGLEFGSRLYEKEVAVGDTIHFGKYNLLIYRGIAEENYYVMPSLTEPAELIASPANEPSSQEQAWLGCPTIERTAGGRLWASWFTGGTQELGTGNYATISCSDNDGVTWNHATYIVKHPNTAVQVTKPEFWTAPDGNLWLFWVQHTGTGNFDGKMGVWASICENPDAATPIWSTPKRLSDGYLRSKPLVLQNGDWVYSAFDWMSPHETAIYASTDQGATWTLRGKAECLDTSSGKNNLDDPVLVEKKGGTLWLVIRTDNGFYESFSHDKGTTWTHATKSSIGGTASRITIDRLDSGNLLMVNHDANWRTNLTAYLSTDDGATWSHKLLLDEREWVTYPDVIQKPDGTIYVIYDWWRTEKKEIYMATFTEQDVINGTFGQGARKQVLVNDDTK